MTCVIRYGYVSLQILFECLFFIIKIIVKVEICTDACAAGVKPSAEWFLFCYAMKRARWGAQQWCGLIGALTTLLIHWSVGWYS